MGSTEIEMVVFAVILVAYVFFVLWLIEGWNGLSYFPIRNEKTCFSIVVAARNEEGNILSLLERLAKQNYPKACFEVLVIDDHSTDNTSALIEENKFDITLKYLKLFDQAGKKQALKAGISSAKFDTIITTDADCLVSNNWLNSINDCYAQSETTLVFGPVTFHGEKSFFEKIQTIEFASLVGAGAATFANGKATMCNGANLSFKKAAFAAVGGYDDLINVSSGDDEFLMHKLFQKNPQQVVFNKSKAGIVRTQAASTVMQFFNQRKRWASKWKHYQTPTPRLIAPLVFLFNLSFMIAPVLFFLDILSLALLITAFATKFTMDFVFISRVLRFLNKSISIPHFLVLSVLYVFYVPLFGILGSLGKYTWKDRQVTN